MFQCIPLTGILTLCLSVILFSRNTFARGSLEELEDTVRPFKTLSQFLEDSQANSRYLEALKNYYGRNRIDPELYQQFIDQIKILIRVEPQMAEKLWTPGPTASFSHRYPIARVSEGVSLEKLQKKLDQLELPEISLKSVIEDTVKQIRSHAEKRKQLETKKTTLEFDRNFYRGLRSKPAVELSILHIVKILMEEGIKRLDPNTDTISKVQYRALLEKVEKPSRHSLPFLSEILKVDIQVLDLFLRQVFRLPRDTGLNLVPQSLYRLPSIGEKILGETGKRDIPWIELLPYPRLFHAVFRGIYLKECIGGDCKRPKDLTYEKWATLLLDGSQVWAVEGPRIHKGYLQLTPVSNVDITPSAPYSVDLGSDALALMTARSDGTTEPVLISHLRSVQKIRANSSFLVGNLFADSSAQKVSSWIRASMGYIFASEHIEQDDLFPSLDEGVALSILTLDAPSHNQARYAGRLVTSATAHGADFASTLDLTAQPISVFDDIQSIQKAFHHPEPKVHEKLWSAYWRHRTLLTPTIKKMFSEEATEIIRLLKRKQEDLEHNGRKRDFFLTAFAGKQLDALRGLLYASVDQNPSLTKVKDALNLPINNQNNDVWWAASDAIAATLEENTDEQWIDPIELNKTCLNSAMSTSAIIRVKKKLLRLVDNIEDFITILEPSASYSEEARLELSKLLGESFDLLIGRSISIEEIIDLITRLRPAPPTLQNLLIQSSSLVQTPEEYLQLFTRPKKRSWNTEAIKRAYDGAMRVTMEKWFLRENEPPSIQRTAELQKLAEDPRLKTLIAKRRIDQGVESAEDLLRLITLGNYPNGVKAFKDDVASYAGLLLKENLDLFFLLGPSLKEIRMLMEKVSKLVEVVIEVRRRALKNLSTADEFIELVRPSVHRLSTRYEKALIEFIRRNLDTFYALGPDSEQIEKLVRLLDDFPVDLASPCQQLLVQCSQDSGDCDDR